MILFELTGGESHPVYEALEVSNGTRQHDFLHSIMAAAFNMQRLFLSQQVLKALNYHAICCLHTNAGEYRPCEVIVGTHKPPAHYRVQALMDDFVNQVNRGWVEADPVYLATWVLYQVNYIHPFINGNGRTARAASYFVLCLKMGGFVKGSVILPELLKRNREEYCRHLTHADQALQATGQPDLAPLHALVVRLLEEQIATASEPVEPNAT